MRIAFTAQLLGDTASGVERYVRYLLDELDALTAGSHHQIDVYVNASKKDYSWRRLAAKRVAGISHSRLLRIGWEQLVFPAVTGGKYDLVHAPAYIEPLLSKVPVVLTVHDLIALERPELCSWANMLHYRLLLPPSIRRAAHIIAPSNWVRSRILRLFNLPADRVTVIYEGVSDLFRMPVDPRVQRRTIESYGLTGRIILFVGNIEPKKNLTLLLQVFDRLKPRYRDLKLVICGRIRWKSRRFRIALKRLRFSHDVVLTGYLKDEAVRALYGLAEVFVFPSLTEGFGVPPLEAMACGTPVVASNRGALAEILSSAALAVDPADELELESSLRRVLDSIDLKQELREKGLAHSKLFSWQKAALETLEVYDGVLSRSW